MHRHEGLHGVERRAARGRRASEVALADRVDRRAQVGRAGQPQRRGVDHLEAAEQLAHQAARCGRSHGTPPNCSACVTSCSATHSAAPRGRRRAAAAACGQVRRDEQQARGRVGLEHRELVLAEHVARHVAEDRADLDGRRRAGSPRGARQPVRAVPGDVEQQIEERTKVLQKCRRSAALGPSPRPAAAAAPAAASTSPSAHSLFAPLSPSSRAASSRHSHPGRPRRPACRRSPSIIILQMMTQPPPRPGCQAGPHLPVQLLELRARRVTLSHRAGGRARTWNAGPRLLLASARAP